MTDLLEIFILGVVQGLTEFLPISSSGHLVVVQALMEHFRGFHRSDVLERNVALHAGTLLSVLVVYWRSLLRALLFDRRALVLLIVGTLPAVVVGLTASKLFKPVLEDPVVAGVGLIVTGCLMFWIARSPKEGLCYEDLPYRDALRVGMFQAAAILPGVSRSGSTIAAGLHTGLSRRDAATYSFLLSVPAVTGACVLEGASLATSSIETPLSHLAIGAGVSFSAGLAALLVLLRMLQAGRLYLFGFYCIPLGIAVLIWQLLF
jgi:undecaprenyl-diphosphatase